MPSVLEKTFVQWIEKHRYPPGGEPDGGPLVISVPSSADSDFKVVKWNSAVSGSLELHATWHSEEKELKEASLYVDIPGFGNAVLFSGKTFKVPGAEVAVNIPGTDVTGKVSFSLKDRPTDEDPNAQDVNLGWNLSLPWAGELEDNRNLFPANASKSKFATEKSDEISKITDSKTNNLETAQAEAASFIRDNIKAGDSVVRVPVAQGTSESERHAFHVCFLGIYQLVGSILPSDLSISANLFIKFPFVDRIDITKLEGDLKNGVNNDIDLEIAQGSAKFYIKNGGELYIDLDQQVKFVGNMQVRLKLYDRI